MSEPDRPAQLCIRTGSFGSEVEPLLPSYDLQGLCAASVLQLSRVPFAIEKSHATSEPKFEDLNGLSQIIRKHLKPASNDERAYLALALSRLSALVEHSLFSLPENYIGITRPVLSADLPLPARYVSTGQLRLRAKERLEREGLWGLGGEVERVEATARKRRQTSVDTDLIQQSTEEQAERRERVKREFDKLKIIQVGREILQPFANRLGTRPFFSGDEPTALDAICFSHLSLMLYLPFPTPIVASLLEDAFPSLTSHTHRMRDRLFPLANRPSWPEVCGAQGRDWSILRTLGHKSSGSVRRRAGQRERDALARKRWSFVAATSATFILYGLWQGIIVFPNRLDFLTGIFVGGDIRQEEARTGDDDAF